MTRPELAGVLEHTRAILLDFDGPVCAVFAGYPSRHTANQLGQELGTLGITSSDTDFEQDPITILRNVANLSNGVHQTMESILRINELHAVESARPTPGTHEFLSICNQRELPIVIVTNNSGDAVERYLNRVGIRTCIEAIFARDPTDSSLLKPNPYLVRRAVEYLSLPADACVLIGDSPTDVTAAHSAGTRSVGYANKPGKTERLRTAGADVVVQAMSELTNALAEAARVQPSNLRP